MSLKFKIASLSIFISFFAYTQDEPPTLSIGLDNLVFNKGVIDVELLAEIIANKQEELGKEFIKRNIIDNVKTRNFTYYNYANNVLNLVLMEKNKKIVTREVLEYTSNLALVYGIAELYVELYLSDNKQSNRSSSIPVGSLRQLLTDFNVTNIKVTSGYTFKLHQLSAGIQKFGDKEYRATDVIIDLIFDVCRNSYYIKNKGFFIQAMNITNNEYTSLNSYLQYRKQIEGDSAKLANVESFKNDIESKLIRPFFGYFEILREINFLRGESFNTIIDKYKAIVKDRFEYQNKADFLKDAQSDSLRYSVDRKKIEGQIANLQFNSSEFLAKSKAWINQLNNISGLREGLTTLDRREIRQQTKNYYRDYVDILDELGLAVDRDDLSYLISNLDYLMVSVRKVLDDIEIYISNRDLLRTTINDFLPQLQTAQSYYNLSSNLEFLKGDQNRNQNYLLSLSSEMAQFEPDNATLVIKNAIQNIRHKILDEGLPTNGDSSGVVAKIYRIVTMLENPNKIGQNLYLANYILDSLNTSILKNLYHSNKININVEEDEESTQVNSSVLKEIIQSLELIAYEIKLSEFIAFRGLIPNPETVVGSGNPNPNNFVDFIIQLNQLDKSSTYDFLFKSIVDAGSILVDKKAVEAFNILINNIKKYIITNDKANTIEFDIEALISFLYDKYAGQRPSPFGLYFGIGFANTNQVSRSLPVGDNRISSLSLASERIGLKFKIKDFARQYANSGKISKPLISDLYFFAYGSGLLYNIANTKTSKSFDSVIIGYGTGISFYNFLDFNISLGVPRLNLPESRDWSYRFVSFGFDVKVTEYLSSLAKKRRENKSQK